MKRTSDIHTHRSKPMAALVLALCVWWLVALAPSSDTPTAESAGAKPAPCNYYYEWIGKTRFPLQADPHATYTYVAVSKRARRDRVGFLVRGEFIHGAWTSWLTYGKGAQPYSGANFVGTDDAIKADPGSVNPFEVGQPMRGTPRRFTLLFEPAGYRQDDLAPSLDGTPTADILASGNVRPYPRRKQGKDWWMLANRNYQALPGYNPGGTKERTFPVVTAVDLRSGEAVDCQKYNLLPDKVQRPPTNPPNHLAYGRVPVRIALKNGAHFDLLGGLGGGERTQFAPKNPPGLVQFTRAPLGPGADVTTVPPPDQCAGYLATRTSTRLVSLVRIPHIAHFTDTRNVGPSTLFPNPVAEPWEASYVSFSMYGSSSGLYLSGDPDTSSIANHEFLVDASGGSTVLVWPRNLRRGEQRRVFAYATDQGWPVVRGGTAGRQTSANVLIRVKAPAPGYFGRDSNLPCFFDAEENRDKAWSEIPVQDGSEWVATASNLGAAAPQGVTCASISELTSGDCLSDLMTRIEATGGSYFAPNSASARARD